MFLRNDSDAINAACEAYSRSYESHVGPARWPGTKHIEAAIDAYLQARGIGNVGAVQPPVTVEFDAYLALFTRFEERIARLEARVMGGLNV